MHHLFVSNIKTLELGFTLAMVFLYIGLWDIFSKTLLFIIDANYEDFDENDSNISGDVRTIVLCHSYGAIVLATFQERILVFCNVLFCTGIKFLVREELHSISIDTIIISLSLAINYIISWLGVVT